MTELDRARRLKRDRDARCKALKDADGAILGFRAERLGMIGDLLVDRGKLQQWDAESLPAIHAAIAAIVRDELGIPAKATRRPDENSDVPSFEIAESGNR